MSSPLTKRELRAALGFTTDAEVATFFDISAAAVCQWGLDDPIPELRQLQFELKRARLTPAPSSDASASRAA